jgi:hypothetical protein
MKTLLSFRLLAPRKGRHTGMKLLHIATPAVSD